MSINAVCMGSSNPFSGIDVIPNMITVDVTNKIMTLVEEQLKKKIDAINKCADEKLEKQKEKNRKQKDHVDILCTLIKDLRKQLKEKEEKIIEIQEAIESIKEFVKEVAKNNT